MILFNTFYFLQASILNCLKKRYEQGINVTYVGDHIIYIEAESPQMKYGDSSIFALLSSPSLNQTVLSHDEELLTTNPLDGINDIIARTAEMLYSVPKHSIFIRGSTGTGKTQVYERLADSLISDICKYSSDDEKFKIRDVITSSNIVLQALGKNIFRLRHFTKIFIRLY